MISTILKCPIGLYLVCESTHHQKNVPALSQIFIVNNKRYLPFLVSLLCTPVAAVELGTLDYKSYLYQPLEAKLALHDVDDLELADLRFSLADRATYRRHRLRPPFDPGAVKIEIVATDSGDFELHLRSRERMTQPIVDILIEVQARQGRILRHYTLLFDPPGIRPLARSPAAESGAPATTTARQVPGGGASGSSGDISRLTQTAATPAQAPRASKTSLPAEHTVRVRGMSISLIAENSALYPEYSVYQIMRAFYLTNRDAFVNGNIDRLIYDSHLVVPMESLVAEVPRRQAIRFVSSVSRDNPATDSKGSVQVSANKQPAPRSLPQTSADPPRTASKTPGTADEGTLEAAEKLTRMQPDLATRRSTSQEFSSLNEALADQNRALTNQNAAVKSLTELAERNRDSIENLDRRLDGVAANSNARDAANTDPAIQQDLKSAVEGKRELARMDRALQEKSLQIEELTRQVEALKRRVEQEVEAPPVKKPESAPVLIESPSVGEASAQPSPARASSSDQPPAKASQSIRLLLWILPALLLVSALALFLWFRIRRNPPSPAPADGSTQIVELAEGDEDQNGDPRRPPGGAPRSEDETGPYKVRLVSSENTDNSGQQDASNTPEEVLLEIDVRLAYEFYDEALEMLQQAKRKFGDATWIDAKTLEIYAATGEHREFLALFEQKRAALESAAPVVWAEIEAMHADILRKTKVSSA
jgi:FimV-like protein